MYRFWHSVTRPLLDTLHAVSIVEIGVGQGYQTELLLPYAEKRNIMVHCIDTVEPDALMRWRTAYPVTFVFHKARSLEALPLIESYDVVLLDGDHNWYTVHEELLLMEKRAQQTGQFPVVLMHDIGWPYGRRDLYYNPENIPADYRHEYAKGGLQPGNDHFLADGFNAFQNHALISGGPRNGVLTAVEDFLKETTLDLKWMTIDGMHGFGILLPRTVLESNAGLKSILAGLRPQPALSAYIQTIETERIAALMNAESHEAQQHNYRMHDQQMTAYLQKANERIQMMEKNIPLHNEEREQLLKKISELEAGIKRMQNSKSWKLTALLRKVDQLHVLHTLKRFTGNIPRFPESLWKKTSDSLSGTPLVRGVGERKEIPSGPIKSIDVIIFFRGNTARLKQTLKSVATQSVSPTRVIIADMTDESAENLSEFLSESRYSVQLIKISYMSELAFHTGIQAGGSDYVVHAEAGTLFGKTYFEDCLAVMQAAPGAGFAYCDFRNIDTGIFISTPPTIEEYDEKTAELLHQCCMVRRDAIFHAWTVTGRGDPEKLWPAMLMEGWTAVKSSGQIEIRATGIAEHSSLTSIRPRATLCLSLSGREWAWPMMQQFLERQTYPHDRIHIVLLDTSQNEPFGKILRSWLDGCDYREYTYLRETVGMKGIADMPRHRVEHQMSDACAVIYNRLARMCTTPLAFVLEEDVIPPDDAFIRLQKLHSEGVVSVSGVYRHRQLPRLVAWDWNENGVPVPRPFMGRGITKTGGNGFGCVLIDGPYFRRTVLRSGAPIRNFDHNFYHQAVYVEGRTALIDWSIVCKHYINRNHWVSPR